MSPGAPALTAPEAADAMVNATAAAEPVVTCYRSSAVVSTVDMPPISLAFADDPSATSPDATRSLVKLTIGSLLLQA